MTFGETAGTPARDDAAFSRTEFSTSVRGAVWSLDPQLAIALPRTMRAVMATESLVLKIEIDGVARSRT